MIALTALQWMIAAPMILALTVFSVECALGLLKGGEVELADINPPSCVVLVPAHNEEAGIARTVANLLSDLPTGGRILVIADNCDDATAERATLAGAEVSVRVDPARRSKAYALEFGREQIRRLGPAGAPQVVIVIDADCTVAPGTLAALARAVGTFDSPVQAACLLEPAKASPVVEVGNFAFHVKNWIRQKGLRRIGAPAVLNGTGMAFPWRLFDAVAFATTGLAEDLDIGVALARDGSFPRFITDGSVWSAAADETASATQKARWEGGFIAAARRNALPMIWAALRKRDPRRLWLGLHLLVPPLTLLLFASVIGLGLIGGAAALGGAPLPLYLLVSALGTAGLLVIATWVAGGRRYLSGRSALRLPSYLAWKIFLYTRMILKPQKRWIRTAR